MEERTINDNESLIHRIQQVERERDELRKDIEQLCLQQSGPSYLAAATRLHFQRTAGLEQEIEILKKKLAAFTRDNHNLQEELSEVYQIKSKLADLHSAEASKNLEAEKQLKFFQGCVASAFAERDNSLMEAERAKEREEVMSERMNDLQNRVQELTSSYVEEKTLNANLQLELGKLKNHNELFEKVISKFYEIRQSSLGLGDIKDCNWEDKCESLLRDDSEVWSFDSDKETSTSKYIVALERELKALKNSVNNLREQAAVGLQIEDHLKKNIFELEREKVLSYDLIKDRISDLRHFHMQNRCEITSFLEQEKIQFKIMLDEVQERIGQLHVNMANTSESLQIDAKYDDIECCDVHITTIPDQSLTQQRNDPPSLETMAFEARDTSKALTQALQEKVSALLLLSQEEERHLLERNVNAALQKKIEELKRNLLQVTNEKVKALLELAQIRQENQVLRENISHGTKQANLPANTGDKSITHEREEGKLKNLLKKTYLSRWVGKSDRSGNEAGGQTNNSEGANLPSNTANYSMDFARMRVEHATLKESIESLEHLTSSVHRLHLALVKAKGAATPSVPETNIIQALNDIMNEAMVIKTALGSSLPVSLSPEAETVSLGGGVEESDPSEACTNEKVDFVSALGLEMVELLILAAQILEEKIMEKNLKDDQN